MEVYQQGHCTVCGSKCVHCTRRASERAKREKDPFAHFWRYVDQREPHECWPWLGLRSDFGHGRSRYNAANMMAHRVAWLAAGNSLHPHDVVRHKCDNPWCVNAAHLEVGTPADNVHDAVRRGRMPRGDDHWSRRDPTRRRENHATLVLGVENASYIKRRLLAGESPTSLARKFGVAHNTVFMIAVEQTYRDVEPRIPQPYACRRGKLTPEQRMEVAKRVASGEMKSSVAREYGVTHAAIRAIVKSPKYAASTGGDDGSQPD